MNHDTACICAICAPESMAAPSPSVQSAKPAESDVELAQMAALFKPLDGKGRALALALVATIGRLQGVR